MDSFGRRQLELDIGIGISVQIGRQKEKLLRGTVKLCICCQVSRQRYELKKLHPARFALCFCDIPILYELQFSACVARLCQAAA